MIKLNDELLERTRPNEGNASIYYGMACEYKRNASEYITEIRDIAKNKIIAIDHMKREAQTYKVIYLNPSIKVILKNKEGKQFIGESTCHEDDIFNVQNGFAIAKKRAEIKKLQYELKQLYK